MHENNFAMLQDHNLPVLDALLPALIEDPEQRGLLDSTIVWVMGEMARSPKINAKAGREHWPQCGFCLLAGGGIRAGVVHGSSDAIGAWPASAPVTPADIVATIYNELGIGFQFSVFSFVGVVPSRLRVRHCAAECWRGQRGGLGSFRVCGPLTPDPSRPAGARGARTGLRIDNEYGDGYAKVR